uniref:Origin recognition complex subunit 2 n=1 Tax=Globisporangium ultimum (strain ATCC 200006 / CBS 805.95 / DAOM BR144) TaxID=431595 RepID=K3WJN7_GLOUD
MTETNVPFGVEQANAYFNARRIKRGKKKSTTHANTKGVSTKGRVARNLKGPAHVGQQTDGGSGSAGDANSDEEEDKKLVLPPRGEMLTVLKQADEREATRRAANHKYALPRFEQHFPLWRSQLLAGQNLLFYGVGSKVALLQCQDIMKLTLKDPREVLPQVYLVIHSIDGLAMRTPEVQTCLSWLGSAPFISIVASIDQINGSSIWREEDSLRFQWISQSINTCMPYSDEIELQLTKQSKTTDQSSSGIKFILQSLTPTDVATLQVVAQHQLAAGGKFTTSSRRKTDAHADYQKVYDVCRKRLQHQTILAMKNSIKCLEDHGLVKLFRVRNSEKLQIPLPEQLIKAEILGMPDDATTGKAKLQ